MLSPAQIIHLAAGTGRTFSAVGDKYTILASGEQTGGAYTLVSACVPPGGGPPPHYHTREEESFYVLEGEIIFTVAERTIIGTAGTFVQIPRTVPHAFKNATDQPARMLVLCAPAGFDAFLAEFGTELPSANSDPIPPTPAEIEKLLNIVPKYGLVLLPPA